MLKLVGVVLNVIDTATVKVAVSKKMVHPKYGKVIKRVTKFLCHVQNVSVKPGDTVSIEQIRPVSKNKYYKISSVG